MVRREGIKLGGEGRNGGKEAVGGVDLVAMDTCQIPSLRFQASLTFLKLHQLKSRCRSEKAHCGARDLWGGGKGK